MPKIASPKPLLGKMAEMKSFMQACLMYIMTRSSEFPDEKLKIMWILLYMQEGAVLKYCKAFLTVALREASIWGWPLTSQDDLIKDIKTTFSDLNEQDT